MGKLLIPCLFLIANISVACAQEKGIYPTPHHVDTAKEMVAGFQLSLTSGIWVPVGNLSVMKNSSYAGFTVGHRANKFMIDFDLTGRFGNKTHGNNFIKNNDTLYSGFLNSGGYIGVDMGYQILRKNNNEFDILFGSGLDLSSVEIENSIRDTYKSPNINAGIGYKLIIRHQAFMNLDKYSYLSFQAKFNYLGYKNPGGTDYSGNAFTFGVVYGMYVHVRYPSPFK